jgi:putative membrane protein
MSKNGRTALIAGGIVLAILILVIGLWPGSNGQQGGGWGGWGGMMGPGMMGFGFGGLMMIPMIIFWGLLIWGFVWLVRGAGGCCAPSPSDRADSALDVLKRRYAKGEIDKQEFEEKKKDLN